jgi:hypothetical protein
LSQTGAEQSRRFFYFLKPHKKTTRKAKKIKIKIRSCSPTIFVKAAAGYPLVVLAGGGEINRPPMYFSRSLSLIETSVRQLWATATIRASSVGSTIYYAVGSLGKPFQLASGHVAHP